MAPLSCPSLRRSKRNVTASDAFKPTSPWRPSPRSFPRRQRVNIILSFSTDFPDLKAIDNLISLGLEHPQIPIHELQRVAMEVYGISSSEVEPDKLLETHGLRLEDADASKKLVIYGSNI
jgi:hypothetical protein